MPLFAPGSIKLKKKEESTEEVTSQVGFQNADY